MSQKSQELRMSPVGSMKRTVMQGTMYVLSAVTPAIVQEKACQEGVALPIISASRLNSDLSPVTDPCGSDHLSPVRQALITLRQYTNQALVGVPGHDGNLRLDRWDKNFEAV